MLFFRLLFFFIWLVIQCVSLNLVQPSNHGCYPVVFNKVANDQEPYEPKDIVDATQISHVLFKRLLLSLIRKLLAVSRKLKHSVNLILPL